MRRHSKALFAFAALFAFLVPPGTAIAATGYRAFDSLDTSGASAFSQPRRVAVDPSTGNALVVDSGNDRVAVFAADGEYLTDFGSATLDEPFGIAVDQSSGEAYVSDAGNGRIVRFQSDGAPTPTYTLDGSFSTPLPGSASGRVGDFTAPLAVAPSGDLLLADKGDDRIQRYDSSGAFLSAFDGADSPSGAFTGLLDLAVDPASGDVLVVDSTGDIFLGEASSRVERFNPDGTHQASIGPDIEQPGLVTVDPDSGYVVIAARLQRLNTPTLYAYEGTERVSESNVDSEGTGFAVYGSAITGLAADPGATTNLFLISEAVSIEGSDSGTTAGFIFEPIDPADLPVATLGAATDVGVDSATLHGTVDPNGTETSYYFEYSSDGGLSWLPWPESGGVNGFPESVAVGSGDAPVNIEQTLSGTRQPCSCNPDVVPVLRPGTQYLFRLVATSSLGQTVTDTDTFTTMTLAPSVQTLAATEIDAVSATLGARVHPHNSETTYQFEFGTDASYGQIAPADPVSAGSGEEFQLVSQEIAGLEPETTYHFRVMATNDADTVFGVDRTFTTGSSAPVSFPQRAFEKVSNDDKSGFDVTARLRNAAATDGERVTWNLLGTGPGSQAGTISTYVAERDPQSGWSSGTPIDPPTVSAQGTIPTFTSFTSDLSKGMVQAYSKLTPDATAGRANLYMRDTATGSYRLLTPVPGVLDDFGAPNPGAFSGPVAHTPDGSHAVYETGTLDGPIPQTPDLVTGPINTYEWDDGDTRLVNWIPAGDSRTCGGSGPACIVAPRGGLPGTGHTGPVRTALSDDGSRIVFHAIDPALPDPRQSMAGQLYVRDTHGTLATADDTTTHISRSERSDPDPAGPQPALFWAAESEHVRNVLFSSCEKLTDDSTADATASLCGENDPTGMGVDLYLADVGNGDITDLTTADPSGADVFGVVDVSSDLSRIYFVARGILDQGAIAGAFNLYAWDSGTTHFVATLEDDTSVLDLRESDIWSAGSFTQRRNPSVRITPDGRYLLLGSRSPISAYGTKSLESCGGARCAQVYLYDAVADRLRCLSCPAGSPSGNARLVSDSSSIPSVFDEPARNLAEDGSYAFFESPDQLVPEDVNGAYDVYEWREGELKLLSKGEGEQDSLFVDASTDGQDVLFLTRDQLVGDDDTQVDLYDARIGGGFPEPVSDPPCEGDACLTPPIVPNDRTPASSGFSGPGDAGRKKGRKPCSKRKVRRKGRCVAKPRKRAQKERSRASNDRRASR